MRGNFGSNLSSFQKYLAQIIATDSALILGKSKNFRKGTVKPCHPPPPFLAAAHAYDQRCCLDDMADRSGTGTSY